LKRDKISQARKKLEQVETPKIIPSPTPSFFQQFLPTLVIELVGVLITMLGTRGAYNQRQKIVFVGLGIVLILLGIIIAILQ